MNWNHDQCYAALVSRDTRFDGVFYTGVTSTGIYCRTICPAPKPLQKNVEFYSSVAACEDGGFRPCLRCRPDLLQGLAPIDHHKHQLHAALSHIENHYAHDLNTQQIADVAGISERQLQRLFADQLSVSPASYLRTRRLHFARQLLRQTDMPITTLAFASGFASIRTFNATFKQHYKMTPAEFRQQYGEDHRQICLSYQAPYDWPALIGFLAFRIIEGLETVTYAKEGDPHSATYHRLIRVADTHGVVSVKHLPKKHQLSVELSESLYPHAAEVVQMVRDVFDLDMNPNNISNAFANDPAMQALMGRYPGIRVPSCWDRFELFVRAILGQFVSVAAARRFCIRVVEQFGEPVDIDGHPELNRLFPTAATLAEADLSNIGTTNKRIDYIQGLAQALVDGTFPLYELKGDDAGVKALLRLHGVGPWTGHYIAMRALKNPDAFPAGDLVLRKAVAVLNTGNDDELPSQKELEQQSLAWQPWRAYVALALWRSWNEFDDARRANKP